MANALNSARSSDNAVHNLRIRVIGAGMGGLTCALALAKRGFTDIEVYEYASNLGFVGAGIQLAPNMIRILDRLGVWKDIEREAVALKETSVRQGDSDSELTHVDLNYIKDLYGVPHMVGHRSSLANGIYEGCLREKAIKFNFSSPVTKVKSFTPHATFTVSPRHGREPYDVEADVLLAADGVKSETRVTILHEHGVSAEDVKDTGQAAYRIMLKREQLQHDPELLALIDSDAATRWIGEKRHIIAYPVSSKTIYNLSTAQPDANFAAAPSATYTTKGSKAAMLKVYSDFCPKVQRMLDLVPEGEVCEWKLRVHAPLPTWTNGSVALLGDACHPTLPHLGQGAAQAIEDAAVIAVVLDKLPDSRPSAVARALKVYERVRKERAETLVELAAASGRGLHLSDGEEKRKRDEQFAASKAGKKGPVPDKWADAEVQKMIYGTDVVKDADEQFQHLYDNMV